ncbi:hypothetical protein [Sphingomonas kyeonggiensis]|uniref:Uncharacterized protein n=1 Tax=Sphingomonas kyeonggiensis TaxID=1268553 RepID=A0A7W6JQF2_9SPHN|nr:hypothetical protein [Sphingomonas kyeonggiensis]MBB4097631.1 hypothetical protein [Sphingomonas kyeonggiensis]
MILPVAIALSIQTVPLAADQHAAATTCIAVLTSQDSPADLDWFVSFNYLGLVAASEKPDRSVESEIANAVNAASTEKSVLTNRRGKLLKACRARFPLAWSSSATLPQDDFERRFLCSTISGSYEGLLDAIAEKFDVSAELTRVRSKSVHFRALATSADSAKHGLRSQAKRYAAVQDVFRKSVVYGNARALHRACEAAFPS